MGIQTCPQDLPADDRFDADGLRAEDILSLDRADPGPRSLEGGVGFISGITVLLGGGAKPP